MKKYFIYKTVCLINNKYYIGRHETSNLNDGYLGSGTHLRNAIKKYGKENFKIIILEFLNSHDELKTREREIITPEILNDPFCMNISPGGLGGSTKGIPKSEEMKRKLRKARLGKPVSEKQKLAIIKASKNRIGTKASDETKAKMSKTRTGKKLPAFTQEHLERLSAARRKRVITEETKKKTSESLKSTTKNKVIIECPHCKKQGGLCAMKKWHFDNCRDKICSEN